MTNLAVAGTVSLPVSTSEQRLCRLAQEAADADDPLLALQTLVELRHELEAFTRWHVQKGLHAGRSFGDIARALGISRQAAHRRYRELAPSQGPRVSATDQARAVLKLARQESLLGGAAALGSEHVLIAVLRCHGAAAEALTREGVTLEAVRARARALAAERDGATGMGYASEGLRGVLRDAARNTIAAGERWLDVNALLQAALEEPEGGATRVLAALGVDVTAVLARLRHGTHARDSSAVVAANGRHRDVA